MEGTTNLTIEKAKRFQEVMGAFTNGMKDPQIIITNDDGTKHPESDKIIQATKQIHKAITYLDNILK